MYLKTLKVQVIKIFINKKIYLYFLQPNKVLAVEI
jgi:hypothetical protein